MQPRQAKLSLEELNELKQLMGALLAILSFWSLASLSIESGLIVFLGGLAATVALVLPCRIARIPGVVWHWAGPVILLLIGVDFILHIPDFMPPLVRMIVLLIIYRILAPRNRREDLQLILLCLFCIVISGVLTVSLLFAFQILIFVPLAMSLLFVICLLDRGDGSHTYTIVWDDFSWPRFIRRVSRVLDVRVISLCALMFALVVAVSSFLFILMPRFDFNQSIPFLEISTQARSGFSEEVRLGEVSEIQEDHSVALSIDVPSLDAVPATTYWRMLVLDKYDDGRFRVSRSLRTKPMRIFDRSREIRSSVIPFAERSGALWTFYMEGGMSRYLPLPGDFAALRFQKTQDYERIPAVEVMALDSVGQNVFSYQIEDLNFNSRFPAGNEERAIFESRPLEITAAQGRGELSYPLTTLELQLAEDSKAALQEMNREILGTQAMSAGEYSRQLTNFLWQRFEYSLRPDSDPIGHEDPIVAWLSRGTQGHCELFAGAFILLAREAGYPARMVVGYAGGAWNTLEDYYVVRNSNAHAWVEIFDAEDQTWLRVDPTPGRVSSDAEAVLASHMTFESGWSAWGDSLRIQWYRRIVNFEQKDQLQIATSLKDLWLESYARLKQRLSHWWVAFKGWVLRPFEVQKIGPLLVLAAAGSAAFLLWRLRYQLLRFISRLMHRSRGLDPVRRQAGSFLRRIQARGIESTVVAELQALRYGPECSLARAKSVFARAKQVLRRHQVSSLSIWNKQRR
jgi:transglutaminase-like putative cysteine protease